MRSRACAAAAAALLGAAGGCAGDPEPAPQIIAISPAQAYSDTTFSIVITGKNFRPAYAFDTVSGNATIETQTFSAFLHPSDDGTLKSVPAMSLAWQDVASLVATMPSGIAAGTYDFALRDPRGALATLPRGFQSLGPDLTAPTVTFPSPAPNSVVCTGTSITGSVAADDGSGHLADLSWSVSGPSSFSTAQTCAIDVGAPTASCPVTFTVPSPATDNQLFVTGEARDSKGNEGTNTITLRIELAPLANQATPVSPAFGPTSGMTNVSILGGNFTQDTQILIDGQPLISPFYATSGMVITGLTPPHDPGAVSVLAQVGNCQTSFFDFTYIAPPIVRIISPNSGPVSGGTHVQIGGDNFRRENSGETDITFGNNKLLNVNWTTVNLIEGDVPPGDSPGLVAVTASDEVAGVTVFAAGFTYVPDLPSDAASSSDGGDGSTQ